ncbi:hypothetical protein MFRU_012g01030 [Monilinia fructicola]|nr:hypothetical protein MFRU_012g01030 [Monilinia fructicola]
MEPQSINYQTLYAREVSLSKWIISVLLQSGQPYSRYNKNKQRTRLPIGSWTAITLLIGALEDYGGLDVLYRPQKYIEHRYVSVGQIVMEIENKQFLSRPDWLPVDVLPASMGLFDVVKVEEAREVVWGLMSEERMNATESARKTRDQEHTEWVAACVVQRRIRHRRMREEIPGQQYMDGPISNRDSDKSSTCNRVTLYHPDRNVSFHHPTKCLSESKDDSHIDPDKNQYSEAFYGWSEEPIEKPPNFSEEVKWIGHTAWWAYPDGMIYYPLTKKFQNPVDGVLSDNQDGSNHQSSHHEHPY